MNPIRKTTDSKATAPATPCPLPQPVTPDRVNVGRPVLVKGEKSATSGSSPAASSSAPKRLAEPPARIQAPALSLEEIARELPGLLDQQLKAILGRNPNKLNKAEREAYRLRAHRIQELRAALETLRKPK